MWDKIMSLRAWCMRNPETRAMCLTHYAHHQSEVAKVMEENLSPAEESDRFDTLNRELFDELLELFVGDYVPDGPPAVAGTIPAPVFDPAGVTQYTFPDGKGPLVSDLKTALYQDSAEQYRRHLVKFAELWNALGIMGFACADSSRLKEFMEHVSLLKGIVKG